MSLPTPSQSVSHKRFHYQCVNHKKKLSLRHPLQTFGSFSFFQASIWLGVNKVLQKVTKSYKNELRLLFQCCILIPRKCPRKTPFQHTVPPPDKCLRKIWMVLQPFNIQRRLLRPNGLANRHVAGKYYIYANVKRVYCRVDCRVSGKLIQYSKTAAATKRASARQSACCGYVLHKSWRSL